MEGTYPTNQLAFYRKRRKLSQQQVAELLGLESAAVLSLYEKGAAQPLLERALALEVIYRVPVAFLFPALYEQIRLEIRDKEDRISKTAQQSLKH
jgi:transcriptional regulator with XRE-family HTH domain